MIIKQLELRKQKVVSLRQIGPTECLNTWQALTTTKWWLGNGCPYFTPTLNFNRTKREHSSVQASTTRRRKMRAPTGNPEWQDLVQVDPDGFLTPAESGFIDLSLYWFHLEKHRLGIAHPSFVFIDYVDGPGGGVECDSTCVGTTMKKEKLSWNLNTCSTRPRSTLNGWSTARSKLALSGKRSRK